MTQATALPGGCLCRSVRYEVRGAVIEAGYCHCRLCQLATGSPVAAFGTVAVGDFVLLAAEPERRRSSDFGERWFCRSCGTALAMRVDHQPATIDFTIATLDDPSRVRPTFHIWTERQLTWFATSDSCPRFKRFRPDTDGLTSADTEARRA